MATAKQKLALIGAIIASFIAGAIAILFGKGRKSDFTDDDSAAREAEKNMEEKIEKTDSRTLVRDSPDADAHRERTDEIKRDFRERLRSRIGQNIHQ
jgi:hypothetical protein